MPSSTGSSNSEYSAAIWGGSLWNFGEIVSLTDSLRFKSSNLFWEIHPRPKGRGILSIKR